MDASLENEEMEALDENEADEDELIDESKESDD